MSLGASILVAIFTMSVVFAVLAVLWAIIRLFSIVIGIIEKGNTKGSAGSGLNG